MPFGTVLCYFFPTSIVASRTVGIFLGLVGIISIICGYIICGSIARLFVK